MSKELEKQVAYELIEEEIADEQATAEAANELAGLTVQPDGNDYSVELLAQNPFLPYEHLKHSVEEGRAIVSFEKIKLLYQTKCFPDWVSSPQRALMVGMYANALNIEPVIVADMMYMMNGRINLMYQAYVHAILRNGEIETIRDWEPVYLTDNPRNYYLEGEILKFPQYEKYDNGVGVGTPTMAPYLLGKATTIRSRRNGQDFWTYTTFTEEQAKSLGVLNPLTPQGKPNQSLWIKNPSIMAWAKTITLVGRRYYYDCLIGSR